MVPAMMMAAGKSKKKQTTSLPSRPYASVFKDSSKVSMAKGDGLSLYLYDDKLYMAVSREAMEGEFMASSNVTSASNIALQGAVSRSNLYFTMMKKGKKVYLKSQMTAYLTDEGDTTMALALNKSHAGSIIAVFDVKGAVKDSAEVLLDVSTFFSMSNKRLFSLKGLPYDEAMSVGDISVKGKESWDGVEAYGGHVSVMRTANIEVSVNSMLPISFGTDSKPKSTVSACIMVSRLKRRESMMVPLVWQPGLPSERQAFKDYRVYADTKVNYYATKRNLAVGDSIVFYVDTLLSPSWHRAVSNAVNRWNDVFDTLQLGRPLVMKNYPSANFSVADPSVNIIALANNLSRNFTCRNFTDPRNGEILSSKITIPRDIASNIRRNGVTMMAEVDSRYRTYFLPDDLISEIVEAYMLKCLGRSLGLATNLAGSHAYSPTQLRSPSFTQSHGISASCMDEEIYNYLALPGDRERGVVLTIDRPGPADALAISCLYGGKSAEEVKLMMERHAGDPRYLFGNESSSKARDPRFQSYDMGNDPVEAARTLMRHIRYTASHASKWFSADTLPQTFIELFPEMSILEMSHAISVLCNHIGGIYYNVPVLQGSYSPVESVPAQLQRKCAQAVMNQFSDFSWIDKETDFIRMGGANSNIDLWICQQGYVLRYLFTRLNCMDVSIAHGKPAYTQDNFLADIQRYVFRFHERGRQPNEKDIIRMNMYVSSLISRSRELSDIKKKNQGDIKSMAGTSVSAATVHSEPSVEVLLENCVADSLSAAGTYVLPYYQQTDLGPLLLSRLKKADKLLHAVAARCTDRHMKDKIGYIINEAEYVLK